MRRASWRRDPGGIGEAGINVPVLIGANPRFRLHRGVHLVAGAIEEARVDSGNPGLSGTDAFLEVNGRAPLVAHDANLQRLDPQAKNRLDPREVLDRDD